LTLLLFCPALLLACPRASAVVDCLEATVADADVVAIAVPVRVWRVQEKVNGPPGRATIRLHEVIKGSAGPEVTLVLPSFYAPEIETWGKVGGPRVVFQLNSDRAPWHPRETGLPLALRTFGWSLGPGSASAGDDPAGGSRLPYAVTVEMRVIYDLNEALAAVRAAAARTVGEAVRYEVLTVPESSSLCRVFPQFQYEELRVPVDDRAQAAAWKWADDPAYALATATVLRHFDSDRNAAILTRLLDHPVHEASGRPGKSVTWTYPVRLRAYAALQRWGRAPRSAAARGPDDFYRPLTATHGLVSGAALVLLVAGSHFLRRRRRRAMPARSEPGPVVAPEPRRFPLTGIVLAAVAALLLWLNAESGETVRELTATVGDSRYWVSSFQGGLQCARIHNWPKRRPLSYGRFALAEAPPSLWNEQDVITTADRNLAGFRRLSGSMWGDWQGTTYPYGSETIPTALVAALAGLLPAWHLLAVIRDRSRRRARAAKGCCIACGYNLHGVRDTTRCPECGTEASAKACSMPEKDRLGEPCIFQADEP
jgi:hypothetical protein